MICTHFEEVHAITSKYVEINKIYYIYIYIFLLLYLICNKDIENTKDYYERTHLYFIIF